MLAFSQIDFTYLFKQCIRYFCLWYLKIIQRRRKKQKFGVPSYFTFHSETGVVNFLKGRKMVNLENLEKYLVTFKIYILYWF